MHWLACMYQQAARPRIWTLDLHSLTATQPMHIVAQWRSPLSYQGRLRGCFGTIIYYILDIDFYWHILHSLLNGTDAVLIAVSTQWQCTGVNSVYLLWQNFTKINLTEQQTINWKFHFLCPPVYTVASVTHNVWKTYCCCCCCCKGDYII